MTPSYFHPKKSRLKFGEYIPSGKGVEEPISGKLEASPFNWSLASILGNFFYSAPSPAVKKVESLPALADADLNIEQLGWSVELQTGSIDRHGFEYLETLFTFASFLVSKYLENSRYWRSWVWNILPRNARSIMSGVTTNREFHAVVLIASKWIVEFWFFNVMFNLNSHWMVPRCCFASMYGSHEILKFVLEQSRQSRLRLELEEYRW